jgi:hypothetical protein
MKYILIIAMMNVFGCSYSEYKAGQFGPEFTPDEYVYFHKELSPNVYLIEVAGDSWYASKKTLENQVEASWDRRAEQFCPHGIKSKKFQILDPWKAYFEELRCHEQSCLDAVVGNGTATCNEKEPEEDAEDSEDRATRFF